MNVGYYANTLLKESRKSQKHQKNQALLMRKISDLLLTERR